MRPLDQAPNETPDKSRLMLSYSNIRQELLKDPTFLSSMNIALARFKLPITGELNKKISDINIDIEIKKIIKDILAIPNANIAKNRSDILILQKSFEEFKSENDHGLVWNTLVAMTVTYDDLLKKIIASIVEIQRGIGLKSKIENELNLADDYSKLSSLAASLVALANPIAAVAGHLFNETIIYHMKKDAKMRKTIEEEYIVPEQYLYDYKFQDLEGLDWLMIDSLEESAASRGEPLFRWNENDPGNNKTNGEYRAIPHRGATSDIPISNARRRELELPSLEIPYHKKKKKRVSMNSSGSESEPSKLLSTSNSKFKNFSQDVSQTLSMTEDLAYIQAATDTTAASDNRSHTENTYNGDIHVHTQASLDSQNVPSFLSQTGPDSFQHLVHVRNLG